MLDTTELHSAEKARQWAGVLTRHVLEFMRHWEAQDLDALGRWFREESRVWVPPRDTVVGLRRIQALFRGIFARYEKITWRVTSISVVNPWSVYYEHSSQGTLKDGSPYSNHAITTMTFFIDGPTASEQISFLSDYFKDTTQFHKRREG